MISFRATDKQKDFLEVAKRKFSRVSGRIKSGAGSKTPSYRDVLVEKMLALSGEMLASLDIEGEKEQASHNTKLPIEETGNLEKLDELVHTANKHLMDKAQHKNVTFGVDVKPLKRSDVLRLLLDQVIASSKKKKGGGDV